MTRRHRTRAHGASTDPGLARVDQVASGDWILTCRAGFERDVMDELIAHGKSSRAAVLAPALVVSGDTPPMQSGRIEVTFARQCMRVTGAISAERPAELAKLAAAAVGRAVPAGRAFSLQVWVPDTDATNRFSGAAQALFAATVTELAAAPELIARKVTAENLRRADGVLVQICLRDARHALVGVVDAAAAVSLAPGGRERMRVPADAPARSAMKLAEAIAWLGVGPEPGEVCVDLGAAPGGWARVLLERRARVIAIDPAELAPEITAHRGVRHVKASAFDWAPEEPVDWLVCDMAWRPLEVAALVAKWGRKRWARTLVLNVKLPMKRKVEMIARVRETIEAGGWQDVRTRHLYHDRDEITLTAWRK